MKVEIFSDIACPWCYVGKKRFEQALAGFAGKDAVEVHYRPFQLDPSLPKDPAQAVPANRYLQAKFGPGLLAAQQRVSAMADGLGIEFNWDQVLATNTLAGHRLLWLADQEGGAALQATVNEALLRAHFTEGRNLSDVETLVAIGAAAGLAADRVRRFLLAGEGEAEVVAQIHQAQALGVSAVPTFVFEGRWAVSGAQELETFRQIFQQVAQQLETTPS